MNKHIAALAGLLLCCTTHAQASGDLVAFPPPENGMVRKVLTLPQKIDESDYMVELIAGKTMETDGVNRYFFTGEIKQKTIEGWGYPMYVIETLGQMAGTRMAPPPGQPKVEAFVTLGGDPYFIPYNSKLPVVIYLPVGAEVRYRVWRAGAETIPLTSE